MVVQIKQFTQFSGEALRVFQVLDAQSASRNFVFISWANAAPCGTNFFRAPLFTGSFTCNIQCSMKRQNKRAGFTDAQTRSNLHTRFFQALDFFQQFTA